MSEKLGSYLCDYVLNRTGVYKKYIIAASQNPDQCIFYLESSGGMMIPSSDRKNCELLRDAQIFKEDTRISRSGRNTYKFFCLTKTGKEMAKTLMAESEINDESQDAMAGKQQPKKLGK